MALFQFDGVLDAHINISPYNRISLPVSFWIFTCTVPYVLFPMVTVSPFIIGTVLDPLSDPPPFSDPFPCELLLPPLLFGMFSGSGSGLRVDGL
jgi:hypothetical protein